MNSLNDDQDLLRLLTNSAAEVNYSPEALIRLGLATAQWQKKVVLGADPPWPEQVEVEEIMQEHLADWPAWVQDLVPAGCRWERLQWPDASYSVRLLTKRGRVLAGQHFELAANK